MSDLDKIKRLIRSNNWRFAKTMSDIPHAYSVRKYWANDEDFKFFVNYIRKNGYKEKFYSKTFVYLKIDNHKYWTMGNPLDYPNGGHFTKLINRAEI